LEKPKNQNGSKAQNLAINIKMISYFAKLIFMFAKLSFALANLISTCAKMI